MSRLRIIQYLKENSSKIWLGMAFILVATLSYEAGAIQESLREQKPVVVEIPSAIPAAALPVRQAAQSASPSAMPAGSLPSVENCTFVGSKNSNKYHTPLSRCAKQIKSENRVCFASADIAAARGYLAGCLE